MSFCGEIGGMGAYIIQNEIWFLILGDEVLKNRLTYEKFFQFSTERKIVFGFNEKKQYNILKIY